MKQFANDLSFALSFAGLLAVSIVFLKLLTVLVFLLLTQLSIPAPGPKLTLHEDLAWIWALTGACVFLWATRLGLSFVGQPSEIE